jgi:hypothetical protein
MYKSSLLGLYFASGNSLLACVFLHFYDRGLCTYLPRLMPMNTGLVQALSMQLESLSSISVLRICGQHRSLLSGITIVTAWIQ